MIIDIAFLWAAFLGLFAIINPFTAALIFQTITVGDPESKRKEMAYRATITSAIVIVFFMVFGSLIFNIFGITIEAFQLAGGVVIARVGLLMLYGKRHQPTEDEEKESLRKDDVSIIPIAIPMLAGPGAITTALVWSNQAPGIVEKFLLLFIPPFIALVSYFILRNAKYIKRILGHNGTNVVEKLMGLLVLVMGVQFLLNAIFELIPKFVGLS